MDPASTVEATVRAALAAVQLQAEGSVGLGDETLDSSLARSHPLRFIAAFQQLFYSRCYARSAAPASGASVFLPDPELVRGLSRSNASTSHWDHGWRVVRLHPGGWADVVKGERVRRLTVAQLLPAGPSGVAPGSEVLLPAPSQALDVQPTYYFAFGDVLGCDLDEVALVRLYFHVRADAAPLLLRWLSETMNRYQVPFRMKLPDRPALYQRADAAVLYCARRYAGIVLRLIGGMPEGVRESLSDLPPLFTRPLGPGMGFAEDPWTGESFGMHRSRLVAEAMLALLARGSPSGEAEKWAAMEARFAAEGLSLARPWLNPGSVDPPGIAPEPGSRLHG